MTTPDSEMKPLVERLRTQKFLSQRNILALQSEAANEILRLEGEIAALREALGNLLRDMDEATAGGMSWITHQEVMEFKHRARTALKEHQP